MSLLNFFAASLIDRGSQTGLEFGGRHYTFAELDNRSTRLARRLAADGLVKGDRIAVYLENSAEFIELYLAALKAGLIVVPINVLYREREISEILADARPRAAVTSAALEKHLLPELKKLDDALLCRAEEFDALMRDFESAPLADPNQPDDPAAIVYTSGTTGKPKGAVLSHRNFAANARNLIQAWRLNNKDRLLLPLPLFHVHGLGNGVHTWLAAGYRIRLLDRFRKETIAKEFLDSRPTVFFGVPTIYERLLTMETPLAKKIGGFMRLFVSGSAPLPAATLERFRALFGHDILERYGMSETLMNTSNPYEGERRAGSVGRPLPGVAIRLADPESGREVADGQVGEVLIQGPNVFSGYWKRPEATAAAFTPDGYFRSGDLGVRSPDGYYTLVGRRTELIISGGFNIYPREIEEFLEEQPGIAEAAVVGEPDRVKGEVPVAYIRPKTGALLDTQAIETRCRESLASFKVPRKFIEVAELPRNALGKLQRHLLVPQADQ